MEAPGPGLWLLRVAGRLDTATAARVLRLVDTQLGAVDPAGEVAFLVIDLGEVAGFERGGPESLRHAPYSAARRGITVYLSGYGGRTHLLPLRARHVLAEFPSFPAAEHAVHALTSARMVPTGPSHRVVRPCSHQVSVRRVRLPVRIEVAPSSASPGPAR